MEIQYIIYLIKGKKLGVSITVLFIFNTYFTIIIYLQDNNKTV